MLLGVRTSSPSDLQGSAGGEGEARPLAVPAAVLSVPLRHGAVADGPFQMATGSSGETTPTPHSGSRVGEYSPQSPITGLTSPT